MIGDHGASVIADAWVKGVRGFDGEAALRALVKNATQTPPHEEYVDGKGRRALAEYLSLGYIPLEQEVKEAFHRREQVSRTLEYAYDDFAIGALARALGREDVAAAFAKRAAQLAERLRPRRSASCAGGTRTAGGSGRSTPRRSSPGSPRARPGTTRSSSPTTWPA